MIVIITLPSYFPFNLTYFSMKFKKKYFFDYSDINFNARLSLIKYNAIFQNSITKEHIKLTFSWENKFYDRKESSLTKYYHIRSKVTVF